jgi:hypothetical protein
MEYGDMNKIVIVLAFPVPDVLQGFGTIYPVSIVLNDDEIYLVA